MGVSKTLFEPKLVTDLISKVKGKSSLAALGSQVPIAFVGNKEFIFSMDSDVDIVAENGAKGHGGITLEPVTIMPIKFEYGARISDEFMMASEEEKVDILTQFNDGFAKKLAAGMDKAAMHGINPRTGKKATNVTFPYFDNVITQKVTYDAAKADANIESAIALVEGGDGSVSGIAISNTMRSALASLTNSAGDKRYPEFSFGGQPGNLGSNALSINKTVSVTPADTGEQDVDHAIVGDFSGMFKWGYGKEISLDVIEYGDPDNTGVDLKGHNQVYLRAEAYLGWAIFDPESFAKVNGKVTNS